MGTLSPRKPPKNPKNDGVGHLARTPPDIDPQLPPPPALPPLPQPDSTFHNNLRALYHHAPHLAQKIDLVDDAQLYTVEPARRQGLTCQVTGPQGAPVYLHSRYDPLKEAQTWALGVENAANQRAEQEDSPGPMCYVIDGFGLGCHVHELFQRLTGDAFLVVSDPDLVAIRTALDHFDYSEIFASGRLIILTAADREEIFQRLEKHAHAMTLGVLFTPPLVRVNADFHAKIHTLISEYAAYVRSTLLTVLTNSVRTAENVLHNLPTYVATEGIDVLRNRFASRPVVIVSAGPSLRKTLPTLKRLRDRVVIVAVQTTLKPLLAAGITPDFVTSLDYHEISATFFENLPDLDRIHLVAEPKAHWTVIDACRGKIPISLLGNEFARLVLADPDEPHDCLPAGCTVAHLAFYLAQYLGGDPIILIGQDLGFTDHVYYSPGTALHDTWRPELGRFCTIEMKEWERIVRHRRLLRPVKDLQGRQIYTDEQMFTYLQQFEKDFAASPARVIDATSGGVAKQFTEPLELEEALAKYGREPIDPDLFNYLQNMHLRPERLADARQAVAERIEEVREFLDLGVETVAIVREMLEHIDDQALVNRRMVRLDELRTQVRQRSSTYRLLCYVSQMAEMFRFRQDHNIRRNEATGKDRQRMQLRRDVRYVTEINAGCERLLGMLEQCLERFDDEIAKSQDTDMQEVTNA